MQDMRMRTEENLQRGPLRFYPRTEPGHGQDVC